MDAVEDVAAQALLMKDKKDRRSEVSKIKQMAFVAGRERGLCESLCHGLSRDVERCVSSFIALALSGQAASWPKRVTDDTESDALADLLNAETVEGYETAKSEWLRAPKRKPRPMTIARSRDARIVRMGENGRIGVALNILAGSASARKATISAGIDASTGESIKAMKSTTRLVMPVSCSKWAENKFLSGKAILRSSIIYRRGDRWFMHAQLEMKTPEIETKSFIGIDRGLVNTLAVAAVRSDGSVVRAPEVSGSDISEIIRAADKKAASARRRGARSLPRYRNAADHILHRLANSVVALAKEHRATVVMENLSGLKSTITAKRKKGARKNPWQRVLKRAQFGKLEQMIEYKCGVAGLPKPIYVPAGGTSMTCSCCGHQHKDNRQSRDLFVCTECGFIADADINAAVQIARRGAMKVKKGDKLVDLHKNMVESFRTRDDGGLGPLLDGSGRGLVAAHASGTAPDECFGTDNADMGQDIIHDAGQNARDRVFAERAGAFSGDHFQQLSFWGNELLSSGTGVPENAG